MSLKIENLKAFLEDLYYKHLSLRKVCEQLRDIGIKVRPKNLIVLFEALGIPRENVGSKSHLLKALGGTNRAKIILEALYNRLGSVSKVHKVITGADIPKSIADVINQYNLEPISCNYLAVYHLMDRLGIINSRKNRKYQRIILLLGGREEARKLVRHLYSKIKRDKNGAERYYTIRDVTEELSEILGDKVRITESDTLEIMKELNISRRQPARQIPMKPFNGNKREKLYIWGLCKGDARVYTSLSSIRIDANCKLSTNLCFYEAFREYLPSNKVPYYQNNYGYYTFSHSFHKESFIFITEDISDITKEIQDKEDLSALLAGLIDSEGSIYFKVRVRNNKYRTLDYHIEITNKDLHLLTTIRNLMERFGFKATIPQSKTGFGAYRLRIYRRDHLVRLIPALLRFMKHREKVDRLAKLYKVLVGR